VKTADAIVEVLRREGVEIVIGYPVNHVLEAAAVAGIRPIIVRQERTGLHMADAMSRITSGDTIGVFCMQHGPGTENSYGGVAQAWSEGVPVLVLPGGYRRSAAWQQPNYFASVQMAGITKTAEPIVAVKDIPDVLRRAYAQMRSGRLGPALVEIPHDSWNEDVETFDYTPPKKLRVGPDPDAIVEAARLLIDARRPVIYAGQGVHWAKAWPELKRLAELLAIPVCTSLEGKSAFDETHELALGSGGVAIPSTVHHFLKEADVIFGIGCSFTDTAFGVAMPKGKTIIHSTLDAGDVNKHLACALAVLGDAKLVLQALIAAIEAERGAIDKDRSDVAREIVEVYKPWIAKWMPKLTSDEEPMTPYRVIWDLIHSVDVANTIITHDAGSPRDQLSPFWKSTTPLSYIGWGKTTQLGYGLGLAMGAKLVRPDALCINVWGDAAIGFTGMDFETAVRERIPILSILFNNFSMAIELKIMPVSTERYRSTDISGDYAAFARALGGYGERIEHVADIKAAIQRGIEATHRGQPALLEFITCKEVEISKF
jgi:thiamine pyrophosphate-dependent acetolactate synthase large subunit-like protein